MHLNLYEMLDQALYTTRINMTDAERKQFYDRHLKPLQMSITDKGDVTLSIKVK